VYWVDVFSVNRDGQPPAAGVEPGERIWHTHWESLTEWARQLPRQVKVPALVRLLTGRLPVALPRNLVLRLDGEFALLRTHPVAGRPLGEWASSVEGGAVVCRLTKFPRPDIGTLALAVSSAAMSGGGLWLARSQEAAPGTLGEAKE
jgi:hypothetical protein